MCGRDKERRKTRKSQSMQQYFVPKNCVSNVSGVSCLCLYLALCSSAARLQKAIGEPHMWVLVNFATTVCYAAVCLFVVNKRINFTANVLEK